MAKGVKPKLKDVIKVTCEGQYVYGLGTTKQTCQFKEVFFIPKSDEKIAQSVIKKHLIKPRLKKKYDNFRWVRICQLTDIQPGDGQDSQIDVADHRDVPKMNREQLTNFCVQNEIGVEPAEFGSVAIARQAVADAYDDKKNRTEDELTNKQASVLRKRQEHEKKAELFKLNEGEFSETV